MASAPSRTLTDFFQPASKRLKPTLPASCKSDDANASTLSVDQKLRMEYNKLLAKSKRNLKLCVERVSKSKGLGGVKLEELLVEETWLEALPGELQKPYALTLSKFVESEISGGDGVIFPPTHLIFNALNSTPFHTVKAVILGQDPYHGPGQAMGLSFSVPEGIKVPSSLVNIFKELHQDLGCSIPTHGNLQKWAVQGVLLLNAVLTGSIKQILMPKKAGNNLLMLLSRPSHRRRKELLIDARKHHVLTAAHPSGLSANRGFFGCRHFSRTNQLLEQMGIDPIDWQL
ncbi:hypothetical protein JHK87_032580 [Glycine soja]|nr:hypothetical protein JHK87_032580 [Glycine soja]